MRYRLIHGGGGGCQGVAFYLDRLPKAGDPLLAAKLTLPDGTPPDPSGTVLCGTCGGLVLDTSLYLIEPDWTQ